jgi:2-amino-4-hydroxy-6-hydroxymethyldihydropteridine diphosphokinase
MEQVFLSIGTNLGNKMANIRTALKLIADRYLEITSVSGVYRTEPVGLKTQPDFYNICVKGLTGKGPAELLDGLKKTELEMGRIKQEKWGPRIIDIDILFYSNIIIKNEVLTIPHPEITSRRFVLEPLSEIAPLFVYPGRDITIKELLSKGVFTENAVRTGEQL